MNEEGRNVQRIDLNEDSLWLQFSINGTEFEIEAFEASDLLADIDAKHAADPHTCLACWKEFRVDPADFGRPEVYKCRGCGQRYQDDKGEVTGKIKISQVFLDDVSALLKSRFGVTRISRSEAARFYSAVNNTVADAKKNLEQSLTALSGSESTLPDGVNQTDAP